MAREQVYATLLLGDSYLPGALVLAHSLRDAGATRRLAVLVTLDSVSAHAISRLRSVYDHVVPVPRIRNGRAVNLHLMKRPDLHSAFTKINLWKQTHFSRIVYVDVDVVAYRAPDELFALPHAFAAAPDTGWPDLFNSGVMVLTPNMGDFFAMLAMVERGISFDGADQGLLNLYFGSAFHRLSFTYNVTPSAHYQYLPACRHFQSSISMVHFIGPDKPWLAGRDAHRSSSPYVEMVGRWCAVHDRHYRAQRGPCPEHAWLAMEQLAQPSGSQESWSQPGLARGSLGIQPSAAPTEACTSPRASLRASSPGTSAHSASYNHEPIGGSPRTTGEAQPEQRAAELHRRIPCRTEPTRLPITAWDAQRHSPPPDSKPEAINFPSAHYEMSRDPNPFVPPLRYPSPPKNMWYEVPGAPPAQHADTPPPIFPWEKKQSIPPKASVEEFSGVPPTGQVSTARSSGEVQGATDSLGLAGSCAPGPAGEGSKSELQTPTIKITPSNPWTSFPRLNAWDDVPEIGRYIQGLQKHRRVKSQGAAGGSTKALGPGFAADEGARPRAMRLTDFPSEAERPSLPVTPAPIRRPSYFGEDASEPDQAGLGSRPLPAAEGVPAQAEWDPAEQLQKLAQQQSGPPAQARG